ncbi:TPA: hypothetical protein ACXDFS_001226 [Klebsiella michiganensis]
MTNNQLTRERLQEIAEDEFLKHGESRELARMALSAMDSEPVAYTDDRNLGYIDRGRETAYLWGKQNSEASDVALYRHAQPSLVPDKMIYQDGVLFVLNNDMSSIERGTVAMRAWNACRAAILQAQSGDDGEPTDDERIMAIEGIHNCERCSDEGWVIGEMGITRCACGQAGNSPVIPEGYVMVPKEPTKEMIDAGWLHFMGTKNPSSKGTYKSMLAAAEQEVPDGK